MAKVETKRDPAVLATLTTYLKNHMIEHIWMPGAPEPDLFVREFDQSGTFNPLGSKLVVACHFIAWGLYVQRMSKPMETWMGSERVYEIMTESAEEWGRWMARIARKRQERGLDPWGQTTRWKERP